MDYATLKWVHIGAVTMSFCGFAACVYGEFSSASWVRHRLARVLPVAVDTVLLLSAVGMLWLIRLPPWSQPWLRAKLVGVTIYIALGVLALRSTRAGRAAGSGTINLVSWVSALLVFGYIVSVALTKSPLGLLAWLPVAPDPH